MLQIDAGDFAGAKSLLELDQIKEKKDPYRETLKAEVALYYGRYDEAEELLREASQQCSGLRSVARWNLARGRLHYWRGEYDLARDLFLGALRNYEYVGDEYGVALSLYHQGQLERHLGRYEQAEEALTRARGQLDGKGNRAEYLHGLVDLSLAVCKQRRGFLEESQPLYDSALELLRKTENGRHYGLALNNYATLLEERGDMDAALAAFEEAATIVEQEGTEEDAAQVRWNLGKCLLRARRWELAEIVLKQARELNGTIGNQAGVGAILQLLAELYIDQNAMEKAEQCAREALAQAETITPKSFAIVARIMLGRTLILRGQKGNAEPLLSEALVRAEEMQDRTLAGQSLMYLAECCLPERAPEAQPMLDRAGELLQEAKDQAALREYERIRTKATHSRIRLTKEGDMIISKSFLPQWSEAKEAVESFLIKHALGQTDDNNTRAAKILGISKVHLCEKRKQYKI
jgi:tetratricopeptide (TPR) repeat protein